MANNPARRARGAATSSVKIIPLGGWGEIGKNSTIIETTNNLVLIDVGVMFPEEAMHGVDLVIPDFSYLLNNVDRFAGIVLTHSHEDHIGALPYLLDQLGTRVPVYGTDLTLGMVTGKLKERGVLHLADFHPIDSSESVEIGDLLFHFINVGHSIPDAVALAIETPVGKIVHSGDFKLGYPGEAEHDNLVARLREVSEGGVLVLLSECVRVESPGRTPSESIVIAALEQAIGAAPGRVIISTFASNIGRLDQIMGIAKRLGRKVAIAGRSLENNVRVAGELGFLPVAPEVLVSVQEARQLSPNQVVLITTGSQGEPAAVLARIAANDHPQIKIVPGDTVILSASPIPGNEETVAQTIDNLFRRGARVIYKALSSDIHVSGHASREELREVIQIVRPTYCVPLHGEYRMMVLYRDLAEEEGIPTENIILADNGAVLEFTPEGTVKLGNAPAGSVLVDGLTVGGVTQVVLRDRRRLAEDGVLIASVVIDRETGAVIGGPDIVARGFVADEGTTLLSDARDKLRSALEQSQSREFEHGYLVAKIREVVGKLVYEQTRKRPMVLPLVTEV